MKKTLTANTYAIVSRAVEEGIQYGLHRFDKYAPHPLTDTDRTSLESHIDQGVMNALCEVIDFGDEP